MFDRILTKGEIIDLLADVQFRLNSFEREKVYSIFGDPEFMILLCFFKGVERIVHLYKVENVYENLDGLKAMYGFFEELAKGKKNDYVYNEALRQVRYCLIALEADEETKKKGGRGRKMKK